MRRVEFSAPGVVSVSSLSGLRWLTARSVPWERSSLHWSGSHQLGCVMAGLVVVLVVLMVPSLG